LQVAKTRLDLFDFERVSWLREAMEELRLSLVMNSTAADVVLTSSISAPETAAMMRV
jgi:hypothetical protein